MSKSTKPRVCDTLEWKLKRRAQGNVLQGNQPNWASDALDMYLEGYTQADIARIMSLSNHAVATSICREALFRLMKQHQADRLDQLNLPKETSSD